MAEQSSLYHGSQEAEKELYRMVNDNRRMLLYLNEKRKI
jgi:hypothetical protein